MREYIRHPSDIPLIYTLDRGSEYEREQISNVSQGGLCFRASNNIKPGSSILIQIPIRRPIFEAKGIVVWCHKTNDHFDVGIEFSNKDTELGLRMVEQVCHIEHYRKKILENEGRSLSGQEAAVEWVEKFAKDFPR